MRNDTPITIIGNLVDDPELRFTPGGDAVAKFTVAHNPRVKDRATGEYKDGEPSFHNCTAWRGLAENIAESLKKGTRVVVAGSIRQRQWKTTEGESRWSWEVTAEAVGPDLTWAQATVRKMARSSNNDVPPDDDWATASRTRPEPALAGAGSEPPF
jgi:single-strand DNA-binding protein